MNTSVNSISDRLEAMRQEILALPEELDSVVRRLNRREWEKLLVRVNDDFNKLLDKLSAPQGIELLIPPLIFDPQTLSFTPVTSEDRSRWRAAHESEIRVVIGEGKVQVMAKSKTTGKEENTVSRVMPVAQQQSNLVLDWSQYQQLLAEIGKLINASEQ